mgnify:CR=1 FL=1
MLKKLGKKRRVLELGFALGFAFTVLLTAFAAHRRQVADRVCADTVRLHILANSDTLEDQLVKLQVRDAILAALPDSVLQADTTTGAEAKRHITGFRIKSCKVKTKVIDHSKELGSCDNDIGILLTICKAVGADCLCLLGCTWHNGNHNGLLACCTFRIAEVLFDYC